MLPITIYKVRENVIKRRIYIGVKKRSALFDTCEYFPPMDLLPLDEGQLSARLALDIGSQHVQHWVKPCAQ